ncbi:hypothetical protein N1F89_03900 [Aquibium sp. A9E412]|uniref:SO2930 family diheme c-type cytochrome n=1 Tax=Aquibium sp. A9E412 TaxID=2976767 RepID=UPI0025AF9420|nr:SO2930 family diheme c-type cytochrome [Aquibium sp. A9E412]MDN2565354.1 hypothetical protein [Aquibium sp. A9E412]
MTGAGRAIAPLGRAAAGGLALALAVALVLAAGAAPARAVSAEAVLAERPPRLLSAFGLFADPAAQVPAAGVVPFAPTTPLFTDHAVKFRFVHVPEGKAARYDGEEAFDFPVGSVLVKTFAFVRPDAPQARPRLVETRLLLRHDDGWQAWAYLWNAAQTDAELTIAGARVPVETRDAAGRPVAFEHAVPNKNQCKGCHALDGAIVPLGPKARNLNAVFAYPDGTTADQLAHWRAAGLLEGGPAPQDAPAVPDWRDAGAPLDARARAWLDVNCAHCHRRAGPASNSGLFLTWQEDDPVALGIGKRPVAAGRGSGGRPFDIAPGRPDESILLYRVESVEPGVMMPELGRSLPDPEAVELLRAWIADMR